MKIDLHCHSKHSKRPTLWLMQKLNCPESFTEPVALYNYARERGMGAVTITDHNVIDGALEIADLPNAFLGCEYTTYFPDDRCKVHILVYGMTEAQHRELTEARENIFDLVRYLRENDLHHVCAHPLFWINDRLRIEHVEQLMLLFKNWELNGDMVREMNDVILGILNRMTPEQFERLADKHGITPAFETGWKKNLTGGSDDHSSLHLTRTYTEVPNATTLDEFWVGVEQGKARIKSHDATPEMFARNIYGIGYQFYNSKLHIDRYKNKDVLLRFLERTLKADAEGADPWLSRMQLMLSRRFKPTGQITSSSSLFEMARVEAEKLIKSDPKLLAIMEKGSASGGDLDDTWSEFVTQVSNLLLAHIGDHTIERLQNARLFDLFHSMGSSAALYTLIAPYFISYSLFAKEKKWSEEVFDVFVTDGTSNPAARPPKIAHFTDTFQEVNGVAITLQQELSAAIKQERDYTIITSATQPPDSQPNVLCVPALSAYSLPDYPELELVVPPFLHLLKHCYDEGYTHIHVATPGAVGLAGLAIGRILHLPVTGTYHTAFPQYAKALTEDAYIEQMMWSGMMWFYEQLDSVYVPSQATGEELKGRGLSESKIRQYPRGVDVERFNPSHRTDALRDTFGFDRDTVLLLYVGRVSREKNLHLLADAFKQLSADGVDAGLVVVGDGPYRAEMEQELAETRAVFTGYKGGQDLAEVYASCDLFVFPSTTDTFGNVVLEAQASGIPVIASNAGGPHENIVQGETGLVVDEMTGVAIAHAIRALAGDRPRCEAMGRAARAAMEFRNLDACFEQLWAMYVEDEARPYKDDSSFFESVSQFVDTTVVPK